MKTSTIGSSDDWVSIVLETSFTGHQAGPAPAAPRLPTSPVHADSSNASDLSSSVATPEERRGASTSSEAGSIPSTSGGGIATPEVIPPTAGRARGESTDVLRAGDMASADYFKLILKQVGFVDFNDLNAISEKYLISAQNPREVFDEFMRARTFLASLRNLVMCREGQLLVKVLEVTNSTQHELLLKLEQEKNVRVKRSLCALLEPHITRVNCERCQAALDTNEGTVCDEMTGVVQIVENFFRGFSQSHCRQLMKFSSLVAGRHALYRSSLQSSLLLDLSNRLFPSLCRLIQGGAESPFPPTNYPLSQPPDVTDVGQARKLDLDQLRVPDGDTLVIVRGKSRQAIRLPDLDAHEKEDSLVFIPNDNIRRSVTVDVGTDSRRLLVGILRQADEIYLDKRSSEKDQYDRSISELWVVMAPGVQLQAVSQLMIKNGGAFPYTDAEVERFDTKRFDLPKLWRETMARGVGICRFPLEVVNDKALRPYSLRQCRQIGTPLPSVALGVGEKAKSLFPNLDITSLKVNVTQTKNQWESITYAKQSSIRNAGCGLFVERRQATIKNGERIALYGKIAQEQGPLLDRSYVIMVQCGGEKECVALPASSGALGRYANMKIPHEALEELIYTAATVGADMTKVHEMCRKQANGRFQREKDVVYIVAAKDIDLRGKDVEIFVDYTFHDYWFAEVLSEPMAYLENCPDLATAVIFAIVDPRSKFCKDERQQFCNPQDLEHLLSEGGYSEELIQRSLKSKRRRAGLQT